jgi:hypothetical protein
MATAIIVGVLAAGASAGAGFTVGALSVAATAAVVGVAAAGMTAYAEKQMDAMTAGDLGPGQVQLGDKAQAIDKTTLQKQADTKIQLGEDESERKKRGRGKAAYKIELDKKAAAEPAPTTGVQAPTESDTGVQL